MTRGVVLTAGIVFCAVPAPGCKHSAPKSFHARAVEICARYVQKASHKHVSTRGEERQAIALFSSEAHDLRQLRPPPSQSATYRQWLAAMDRLARELERERVVLGRDEARLQAALRREKVPDWKPSREELEHPTSAILTHTLEPLPEWHVFVRDVNRIMRESKDLLPRFVRLGKQLGLRECVVR